LISHPPSASFRNPRKLFPSKSSSSPLAFFGGCFKDLKVKKSHTIIKGFIDYIFGHSTVHT